MVRKYCVLYFAVLILFIVIIVAPAVASDKLLLINLPILVDLVLLLMDYSNQEMSVIMILAIIDQNLHLELFEYSFYWNYHPLFYKSIQSLRD